MMKRAELRRLFFLPEKLRAKFQHLTHLDRPEGSRILVLSPHPDDDVLGCGGTIALHRQLGHEVRIVYLTYGEKGIPGLRPDQAMTIRQSEATRAAAILGVESPYLHFLALPDGQLLAHVDRHPGLMKLLEDTTPDVIYLPSFIEAHRDHYAANLLLKNNLRRKCMISAYEVWTPHMPNRLINISPVLEIKRRAMLAHESQLRELDYLDALLGLNRYRAGMFHRGMAYAEAFLYGPSGSYFRLFEEGIT